MTLTVDITDLSNETGCELVPKQGKIMLYLPFITQ